jgi:chemotaxis response regulator CheB
MNDLSQVPGLAGYIAAQQQGQQQTMGNLNVANLLEQLQQRQAANQKEQAYRQELSGLGASPTQEQLAGVAAKYGGPDALLKIQQGSLDRQAALAQQKTIADDAWASKSRWPT